MTAREHELNRRIHYAIALGDLCAAERDKAVALLREVTVTDTGQGAAIDAFLNDVSGDAPVLPARPTSAPTPPRA
jgi:hypothetical protein